jgi:biopolymer transport protein ExbB
MTPSGVVAVLVKGGPVMIPLFACSVISVAVILERCWFWWRRRGTADAERVLELARAGKFEDALDLARRSRSPVARVLAAGVECRSASPATAMEAAARAELVDMRRFLPALDTIVTLSPLLGLLGTVTGMIGAFGVMASSGINQPHAITGGVAEALIATAAGLGVAITTLVPYNYFSARAERMLDEIERGGARLELILAEERS